MKTLWDRTLSEMAVKNWARAASRTQYRRYTLHAPSIRYDFVIQREPGYSRRVRRVSQYHVKFTRPDGTVWEWPEMRVDGWMDARKALISALAREPIFKESLEISASFGLRDRAGPGLAALKDRKD